MTDASATLQSVGRNETCPCGSGKKYKKCCMRTHQVMKEAAKSSREPQDLIGEHTTPWDLFKLLRSATESNMPKFQWAASHDSGPWRAQYPEDQQFFAALGSGDDAMIAREGTQLLRVRHHGPMVTLLLRRAKTAEVVELLPNELDANHERREVEHWGLRVWSVTRHEIATDDDPTFESVGYAWT